MNRKFLCMLLCAALLLSAAPLALASGYGQAPSLTLETLDGDSLTMSELAGSPVVLVFGRLGETLCYNTNSTLNALNGLLSESDYSNVKAYFLEIESSNTAAAVGENIAQYSNVTACVTGGTYASKMWSYLGVCDSTISSFALPAMFFIDANGDIVDYSTGIMYASDIEPMLNFGETESSDYGQAANFTMTTIDGDSIEISELAGSPVVLVFGRMGEMLCYNTNSTLNALNGLLSNSDYGNVKAYFLEIESSNTASAVSENIAQYSNVTACVTEQMYGSQMWSYLRACGYTGSSVSLPAMFFIDANGDIVDYSTGIMSASEIESILSSVFEFEEDDNSDSGETPLFTDNYVGSDYYGGADEYEWEVLRLTNKARMQNGLLPLSTFETLQKAAGTRAYELVSLYSHTRPNGEPCFTILADAGLYYYISAENIAAGQSSPSKVVNAWLNSSGHYANIMNSGLCHLGVGYDVGGSYGRNWVQLFFNRDCSFDSMELLNTANLTLESGESIDDLGVVAVLNCKYHGSCYMPVIEEMCSGYDENINGTQRVTVTYGSLLATFNVTSGNSEDGVSGVSAKLENGTVTVTAQYKNSGGQKVFAAGYCDGEMIDLKEMENGEAELDAGAEKVKVFMWETLENMRPVGSAVEATVEK